MPGSSAKSEDIQKIILALLVSQKDAVSLTHLDKDYKEQEGECIPWKELGYISLFDYLKSMPKYFHLERINGMYYVRGIASDKSKHVSSLVARQKTLPKKQPYARRTYKPSCYYPKTQRPRIHIPANILSDIIHIIRENPNGIKKEYILRRVNEKLPYVNISIMDLEEQLKDLSHELFLQGNLIFPTKSKTTSIPEKCISSISSEISTKVEKKSQSQNVTVTPKYCVSGDSDSEPNIDDDNDFSFVPNDNISYSNNENNKNTMSKKKQPISMFIQETVSKCHIQGDKINGSIENNITENEHYNRQNNVASDIDKEFEGDGNYYIGDESAKLLINERTRFRLEKLIQKYPNGIWCAELPDKFLQEYDRSLNYIELGFNSVREFASCLPEIFQCKQLQPSGDFILYDAKHELSDAKKKDKTKSQTITEFSQFYQEEDEIEALPSVVSSDTSNKLMPEGVMVIGETVGQIDVVSLKSISRPYIEVFVEEVFTPSLFWVQLRKKKKIFNKMMEELHIFYEEKSSLYKIPLLVIEKGLNCACIYNNQWHRGIIKQVKPDLQVTVMFYDYGTLKTYPPDTIYYLHRSFSYLPAQAIPCGLFNTKPCIGEQWSQGVTHEFAFRTAQKALIATIVSIDPENNSMLVTLTDTNEEEDVHINDWLVQQNLALHGKMVRIRPRNFPYRYYLECKKYGKTNSIDCISSKSSIAEMYKRSILPDCSTENSTPSNRVLSASVNSNSHDNFLSNDPTKDTQISPKSKADSVESNNFTARLVLFFEKTLNSKKLSSSSYEEKSHNTQLHSDINMTYKEKNESKTELNRTVNSNSSSSSSSSSIKSNDPIPTSPNNCIVNTQLQKQDQDDYSNNTNCKDFVENQNVNIRIQKNEQKQKNIPLPKNCFINAVKLSVDSKSYYPDYDTLPDDNINIINDTNKLITKRKHKINLKNIEIGVSEIILSALRSSRNHANNECNINTSDNGTSSSNQIQNITTDFQRNYVNDNNIIIPNIQKLLKKNSINENENCKFNDESTKFYNMMKEECMLLNRIEHNESVINNTIDTSGNSASIHDYYSANLKNTMHRFETFNTLLKLYDTCNDDPELDSDDSINLENCNTNYYKIDTKVLSSTSNMSTDSIHEEISDLVNNTDTNESSLVTSTCDSQSLLENEDNKTEEQVKFNETIYIDPDEQVIPSYNDNDMDSDNNEWDVVGNMHDFFTNYFPSNVEINHMVQNDDEEHVQIREITDNKYNEKCNK